MEVLIQIASYLDAKSLRSFRRLERQYARAGLSLIPRNGLPVLNYAAALGI